jgi:tetratricopeptide (TPR) repeat protein
MASRIAVVATVLAALVACDRPRSDRVQLVEAAALARQGQVEDARAMFHLVLERSPENPDALLRYADFLIDAGELREAGRVLNRLGTLTLTDLEQERRDDALVLLHTTRLERVRGSVDPGDVVEYEDALIALANVAPESGARRELEAHWLASARAALGHPASEPLTSAQIDAIAAARYQQVLPALTATRRVVHGDDRLTAPQDPEPALAAEAERMLDALERRNFGLTFDAEWLDRHQPALVRDGRYDEEADELIVRFSGTPGPGASDESTPSRLAFLAQTWRAREEVTDLAYRVRRLDRTGAPPLPFRVEEFASVEVRDLVPIEGGAVRAELRIPYATVRRAVQLLDERREAAEAAAAAETGAESEGP